MLKNKKIVIALCVVLAALLCVLFYVERTSPESGSEFIQGLMR